MWESIKVVLQFFLVVAFCFSMGYEAGYEAATERKEVRVVEYVEKRYPDTFEHLHKWTE